MLYVMRHNCYNIYVCVIVYCKIFMQFKNIQTNPIKEKLEISLPNIRFVENMFIQSLNGSRLPIPQLARTKVSLMSLVRPQQLCSGMNE